MDAYDSPLRVPYSSPYNPLPHSLLRTRQQGLQAREPGAPPNYACDEAQGSPADPETPMYEGLVGFSEV